MDVKSAFLNHDLIETIFVQQPVSLSAAKGTETEAGTKGLEREA